MGSNGVICPYSITIGTIPNITLALHLHRQIEVLQRTRRRAHQRHGAETLQNEQQGVGLAELVLVERPVAPGGEQGRGDPLPRVMSRDLNGVRNRPCFGGQPGDGGGDGVEGGRRGLVVVGFELGADGKAWEGDESEADQRVFLQLALRVMTTTRMHLDENGDGRLLAAHCQDSGGEQVLRTVQVDGRSKIGALLEPSLYDKTPYQVDVNEFGNVKLLKHGAESTQLTLGRILHFPHVRRPTVMVYTV